METAKELYQQTTEQDISGYQGGKLLGTIESLEEEVKIIQNITKRIRAKEWNKAQEQIEKILQFELEQMFLIPNIRPEEQSPSA